jgi:hypothetical protein
VNICNMAYCRDKTVSRCQQISGYPQSSQVGGDDGKSKGIA